MASNCLPIRITTDFESPAGRHAYDGLPGFVVSPASCDKFVKLSPETSHRNTMSRFCRLFADLRLYFAEECGKVIHGYGMRRKGERLGAALRLMTKPDCEGTRVPG